MQKKFFLGLGAILIIYAGASFGIALIASFNQDQIFSLYVSGIIATVNVVIAFLVVKFSMHKGQDIFTKIFLSGMVIRLLGLLAVIFLVLKYSRVDHFVFIGSLFILYFIYQVWEVLILNSKNEQGLFVFMALLSDSTAVADSVAEHSESLGGWITEHLQNSPEWHPFPGVHIHLPHFEPINILGMHINLSITNHVVMLWFAAIMLFLLFGLSLKPKEKVQRGVGNLLEMLIIFIRDEVAIANMGEKEGRRFTPFLVSAFFFVLISNLMGLIPIFSTSTANINVTAGLALTTFGATQYFGVKEQGLIGYYKNLVPSGVPFLLWPLMFVIELMGLIAKHVALTIRLFANMNAGHIVLFAFLGLTILFKSFYVSPVAVGFGIFVYFLELLVAVIQAYIFTVLSSLFIGMSVNPEH